MSIMGTKTRKSIIVTDSDDLTKKLVIEVGAGVTTGRTLTITSNHTDNRTITLPDETTELVGASSTVTLTNKTLTSPVIDGSVSGTAILDEDNMASDSDTQLATQQSIKAYVDTQVSGVNDASEINYDNSSSGLTATDAQAAIDEVEDRVDTAESNISTNSGDIATNVSDISTINSALPTGDVVGSTDSQTLTNKTIDADSNTISNLEHGAEVDDPSSGVHGVSGSIVGTTDAQTISSKTFSNNNTYTAVDSFLTIQGSGDNTKQFKFEADGISTGTTRIITVPDASFTMIGDSSTDTLTNKTIDADNNTISNLEHGSEVDNPTSGVHGVTGNVVGTTDAQTLTNKTIDGDNNTISNLAHGAEVDNPSSGVHGVTGSVVGTTDTQTLTNKTLTSSTIETSAIFDNQAEARFREQSGNGTNYIAIEAPDEVTNNTTFKLPDGDGANGQALKTDGSGNLSWGTAGGGGAGKQYFSDSETADVSNYTTFDDGAVTTPVDGIDGSPSTISVALKTSSQFYGESTLEITKTAANGQGEGVSWDTDITLDDNVQAGEPLYVKFRYKTTSGYSTAGENIKLFYYRVGGTTTGPFVLSGVDGLGNYGNTLNHETSGRGQFQAIVDADSATTAIRIIAMVDDTDTTAYTLEISDIKIESQAPVYTSIATDWESYTPTYSASLGTVVHGFAQYKRDGENLSIRGRFTTGTVTTGTATISLPSGLTIETPSGIGQGQWHAGVTSTSDFSRGSFQILDGATTVTMADDFSTAASSGTIFSAGNANVILSSSSEYSYEITNIPIEGWAGSSNVLNSTQIDFQNYHLHASSNNGQTVATGAVIVWEDIIEETHPGAYNNSTGVWTAPADGVYQIIGSHRINDASITDRVLTDLRVNGSAVVRGQNDSEDSGYPIVVTQMTKKLLKGDTVDFIIDHSEGGSTTLRSNQIENNLFITKLPDLTVIGNAGKQRDTVVSKTGAYTIQDSDDTVLCDASSGAFTVTLPSAVGRNGAKFRIKKTDSSYNVVTLDGDGSETIDGDSAKKLTWVGEFVEVTSDGSNWHVVARHWDQQKYAITLTWNNENTLTFSTNLGWVEKISVDTVRISWLKLVSGGTGSGSVYTFTLPNSWSIDTAKASTNIMKAGQYFWWDNSGSTTQLDDNFGPATYNSTTLIQFIRPWDSNSLTSSSFATSDRFSGEVDVPLSQWSES